MANLETIKKQLAQAEKAQAEIEKLTQEADQKVTQAQEALENAKQERRELYESLGLSVHKGRPKGSKNKPKQDVESAPSESA